MIEDFGVMPDGRPAHLYTITGCGLTASVTDCGAALVRLLVPDRRGVCADVVLGYDRASGYCQNEGCLGAVVGRNANRIGGAAFCLNGREYRLAANDKGCNNLHSGPDFWFFRHWQLEALEENAVALSLNSPHGDQGFPGNARVQVTYRLEHGGLTIEYRACCDLDCPINLTHHAYWNLAGQDRPERAMEQLLWLNAAQFTESGPDNIPTGRILPVAGRPLDFTQEKPLCRDLADPYLEPQRGFDHNLVLAGPGLAARLTDPGSGRVMTVYTDRPGLQVYTANFLQVQGKNGVLYPPYSAVCLETQSFPDSVNQPQWPSPVVPAGEQMQSITTYRFSAS